MSAAKSLATTPPPRPSEPHSRPPANIICPLESILASGSPCPQVRAYFQVRSGLAQGIAADGQRLLDVIAGGLFTPNGAFPHTDRFWQLRLPRPTQRAKREESPIAGKGGLSVRAKLFLSRAKPSLRRTPGRQRRRPRVVRTHTERLRRFWRSRREWDCRALDERRNWPAIR